MYGSQFVNRKAYGVNLEFDPNKYTVLTIEAGDHVAIARAYENIVYVSNPSDVEHQVMNIYVPEAYFKGETLNGYNAETAPIFLPNAISQYFPGIPLKPRISKRTGAPNASLVALFKGYVVVAPAVRGRTSQSPDGRYTGKAPACIVDMKACIRYLRYNCGNIPGNMEKIVPNGFSAGGAVAALLGASGNNRDYEPFLQDIGAAEARDDVFAASCYCPVYNLEHLDIGYEWQSSGIMQYGFRDEPKKELTAEHIKIAGELQSLFPTYLNSLGLLAYDHINASESGYIGRIEAGTPLKLDAYGNGTYKDFAISFLIASAQKALDSGKDLSGCSWLSISADGTITDFDQEQYRKGMSRMRPPPIFDDPARTSAECELFGSGTINSQHYTHHGMKYGNPGGTMADVKAIRLMNPLHYINTAGSTTSKYWRIRHGTLDFGNMLTNPIILATSLQNRAFNVDCELAWGQPHGGDYDMDELFGWLDRVCGAAG